MENKNTGMPLAFTDQFFPDKQASLIRRKFTFDWLKIGISGAILIEHLFWSADHETAKRTEDMLFALFIPQFNMWHEKMLTVWDNNVGKGNVSLVCVDAIRKAHPHGKE